MNKHILVNIWIFSLESNTKKIPCSKILCKPEQLSKKKSIYFVVLQGQWIERDHCVIDNQHGIVTLRPLQGAQCIVNGHKVTDSFRLSQGKFYSSTFTGLLQFLVYVMK